MISFLREAQPDAEKTDRLHRSSCNNTDSERDGLVMKCVPQPGQITQQFNLHELENKIRIKLNARALL